MDQYLKILLHIVNEAGMFGEYVSSTTQMAKDLDMSQQTVSRKLIEMQESQLIQKEIKGNGIVLCVDAKGRELLAGVHSTLCKCITEPTLKGIAKTGLGEGSYYMSLPLYKERFKQQLGFLPYPGTFNLEVNPARAEFFLGRGTPIVIKGFKTAERSFGGLDCFKAKLGKHEVTVARPHRTHHPDTILELIAPFNLRKKLKIREGDEVKVTL